MGRAQLDGGIQGQPTPFSGQAGQTGLALSILPRNNLPIVPELDLPTVPRTESR